MGHTCKFYYYDVSSLLINSIRTVNLKFDETYSVNRHVPEQLATLLIIKVQQSPRAHYTLAVCCI